MPEESVNVYLPVSNDSLGNMLDWEEMCALENSLRVVLDESLVGTLKVSRADEGYCRFKIIGPSADEIHKAIQRTLATSRLSPSGYVLLRYADGREPVKVPLRGSHFIIRHLKGPLTVVLGVLAGVAALGLHYYFSLPRSPSGEPVRLPPLEAWLLTLEGGSVFLGVGFYVARWFARWLGDHYSAMVMKYRQSVYLGWVNGLCGVLLLMTRSALMLHYQRLAGEDAVLLLLGAYLVFHSLRQHYRERSARPAERAEVAPGSATGEQPPPLRAPARRRNRVGHACVISGVGLRRR